MAPDSDPIEEILGPSGLLALSLKDFEFRFSQVQMAQLIRRAMNEEAPCIIEAGTGTGKTIGYLVPLILSGKKAVISTGTKNLQEQIFFKDIPLLSKAIGHDIDAMLMKGRKNYLCLHRYHQYFSRFPAMRPDQKRIRKRLDAWLKRTEFADRAELGWMRDDDPLWDAISSTSEQCLGSECLHSEDCYLNSLRRSAAQARIIIVNHHLFFADLMVKKGGFGEIIPRFQALLFDEAHSIEEIATTYLGLSLSTHQLLEFASDLDREMKNLQMAEYGEVARHLDQVRTGAELLRQMFSGAGDRGRLDEETLGLVREGPARTIREGLRHVQGASDVVAHKATSFQAFLNRAAELAGRLEEILSFRQPGWLIWYENRKKVLVLHASPLDISESMKELLYQKVRAMVFTSATLATGGNFDYFRGRVGLDAGVLEGIYPSHFDFEKQTLLYVPKDLPLPNDPIFGTRIAERIIELLRISAGRALVLFTSYHNLNRVYDLLTGKVPYMIYKQGDAPRSALLEAFKSDTHSVLLATGSFWEGVDVPGEALSCLIIDKLPFDSPGEPLVAARIESLRSGGENPFMKYQLPSAIIALKQGLGRLIRNSSDRGILSVLDARLLTSRYGRFFLESLPQMPLTHDLESVSQFFSVSS